MCVRVCVYLELHLELHLECISSHLEVLPAAAAGIEQRVAREEIHHRGLPRYAAQRLCGGARRRRVQLAAGDFGGGGEHGDCEG